MTPIKIVTEISKKAKCKFKELNLRIQLSYTLGKDFYACSEPIPKLTELHIPKFQPQQPLDTEYKTKEKEHKKEPKLKLIKNILAKNILSTILSKQDNEYIDEFDKQRLKQDIKELEDKKADIERNVTNLKEKLESLQKSKITNVFSKAYLYNS